MIPLISMKRQQIWYTVRHIFGSAERNVHVDIAAGCSSVTAGELVGSAVFEVEVNA